jgi:squalene-associated FAD-dependent desaturase
VDRDAHELAGTLMGAAPRVAVVGGGWAGLACAVEATLRGWPVTLFEMAPQLGGRARRVDVDGLALDNGQHILIGAYRETLRLMRTVGIDLDSAFVRTPLRLPTPRGGGLHLPPGSPMVAFARGVLALSDWPLSSRIALLRTALSWAFRRFRCDPSLTVAELTAGLPAAVRADLIEPLCVAALNTPAAEASGTVFLRVIRDALFSGPGSADLLLPRLRLSTLLPDPAASWLAQRGAVVRTGSRVNRLEREGAGWRVDGEAFDAVLLATTPVEAARLTQPHAPAWAATAAGLRYEPIVTVYAQSEGTRLSHPMLALASDEHTCPAQFVFDLGQLGAPAGRLAFVISGARPWLDRGIDVTREAALAQARQALATQLRGSLQPLQVLTEKRATFRCTPSLARPPMAIAPGLLAAGDYVDGPYPATLEGAVRAAVGAVQSLALQRRANGAASGSPTNTPCSGQATLFQ